MYIDNFDIIAYDLWHKLKFHFLELNSDKIEEGRQLIKF